MTVDDADYRCWIVDCEIYLNMHLRRHLGNSKTCFFIFSELLTQ
jgi:hypothetical protein